MAKKSKNLIEAIKAEDDWQTESDLRTLMESERIKSDQKRLAKARAMAKKKMMEAAKVAADDD